MSTLVITIWLSAFFLLNWQISVSLRQIARYIKEGRCKG